MKKRVRNVAALIGLVVSVAGCATSGRLSGAPDVRELRTRAVEVVKRGVRYKPLGSVRAQGIEVLYRRLPVEALPWLRNALYDDDPGVRFAAVCALGEARDDASYRAILELSDDPNPSLRLAVLYALHRLGDTTHSARLPQILLNDPSPQVRRDAAFVLGLLGEPDAVKLLANAMQDDDAFVREQALASMALLGSGQAIQQLTIAASSGLTGRERLAAINALAELEKPELADTFRFKLKTGRLTEIRLSAARALGRLGSAEGYDLAIQSLSFARPQQASDEEPASIQISRVRQLGATALGAIGDDRALPALRKRLYDASDPHVQIAAADAILSITDGDPRPRAARPRVTSDRGTGR